MSKQQLLQNNSLRTEAPDATGADGDEEEERVNILQRSVHNVMTIREWRHTNVDKHRKLLAGVGVTPPRDAA